MIPPSRVLRLHFSKPNCASPSPDLGTASLPLRPRPCLPAQPTGGLAGPARPGPAPRPLKRRSAAGKGGGAGRGWGLSFRSRANRRGSPLPSQGSGGQRQDECFPLLRHVPTTDARPLRRFRLGMRLTPRSGLLSLLVESALGAGLACSPPSPAPRRKGRGAPPPPVFPPPPTAARWAGEESEAEKKAAAAGGGPSAVLAPEPLLSSVRGLLSFSLNEAGPGVWRARGTAGKLPPPPPASLRPGPRAGPVRGPPRRPWWVGSLAGRGRPRRLGPLLRRRPRGLRRPLPLAALGGWARERCLSPSARL